jgi:hypothetical protein
MSESALEKPWQVEEISYAEAERLGMDNLPGNSQKYAHSAYSNFVVVHRDHGIIGKADLYEADDYVIMEAAEIPEYRGLEFRDDSPFGDLIEARIDAADGRDMKTSAVTDHGKTQYKYSQYDFNATGLMPLPEPGEKPLMPMWNGEFQDQDVFVAPEIEEFVEYATEGLFETRFRNASKPELMERGYQISDCGPDRGPLKFNIDSGDETPGLLASRIDTKAELNNSYITSALVELEDPASQAVTKNLYERGYRPIRVEMPVRSTGMSPQVVMGKLHEPVENLELTDESIELLEKAGLNFEVVEKGEKSTEVDLLESDF